MSTPTPSAQAIGPEWQPMDCAEAIADAMEEDAADPDFPEIDEITRDDLISAAETIRKYAYLKKIQEDDSND
jgi:hypothetical protein